MKTYQSNAPDSLIEKVKEHQLDDFYTRFLLISVRELLKVEMLAKKNVAPLSEDDMKRFERIAKVTKDIGSELRAYQKERLELDDEQLFQVMRGIANQKPELLKGLLEKLKEEEDGL